jgi:hypothetical protein
MPSELDTHDILFNPARRRPRSPSASSRGPEDSQRTAAVDGPATDRAVAYAIENERSSPWFSARTLIALATVAAALGAVALMRVPELRDSGNDPTDVEQGSWWTPAREQRTNETLRLGSMALRAQGSRTTAEVARQPAAQAAPPPATQTATPPPATQAATPAPATPQPAARTATPKPPVAPAKTGDNPYDDTTVSRSRRPAAAQGTDNPY